MFRTMIRAWMLCCLMSGFASAQTEFSADVVNTGRQGDQVKAKIYFAKDKVRFEPAAGRAAGPGGELIMDLTSQTSTVLMDQQHMYMEMPAQMASQRLVYNFFRTGDVENACSDWMQQTRNKGGSCHKVGNDTVNGRNTVKYAGTNAEGKTGFFWIDPKIRFPVKWQDDKNDGGELRNIQEAKQPASLFEIPAGYTKFDMGGGMTRNPK